MSKNIFLEMASTLFFSVYIYTERSKEGCYIVTIDATNQDGDCSAVGSIDCRRTGQCTAVPLPEQLGLYCMGWNLGKLWERDTKQWRFSSKQWTTCKFDILTVFQLRDEHRSTVFQNELLRATF
jgi:hypothetical protein